MIDPEDLTDSERAHIIRDVANWKAELEESNRDFDWDDLEEFIDMLCEESDDHLLNWWYDCVGEWVLSRHDMVIPSRVDDDDWLDYQLARVMDGLETDYGYLSPINLDGFIGENSPYAGKTPS